MNEAVAVVPVLVHPPGVVEQGEQGDDFAVRAVVLSGPQPVLPHPRPVNDAVVASQGQDVPVEDGRQDRGKVMHRPKPSRD
jgi:hypothetical protein